MSWVLLDSAPGFRVCSRDLIFALAFALLWRATRMGSIQSNLKSSPVFIERQHTFTSGFIHRSEIFRLTIKRPKMGKMLCNLRL